MRLTPTLFSHAETLLADTLRFTYPADSVVSRYFRQHRELGHADRGFIAEAIFAVLRRKRSLAARCGDDVTGLTSRRLLFAALACVQGSNRRELEDLLNERETKWLAQAKALDLATLAPAIRCDLPDWLYDTLLGQDPLADEAALARLANALNQPAPLDVRINPLKTDRAAVLEQLSFSGIKAAACPYSPLGVRLQGKPALSQHPLFLNGLIEVQDEGSQLLGYLLQPKRGEMVADFCAGAGGKTLLLGALMRSQGRLYAFDVSEKRLANLKPRLARSGLSNVHPARIASENDLKIKRLAGKLDRVLVDAPCSGLGTLRRNPDLKWRQTPHSVAELAQQQRAILRAAAALLKPGGRLVYATCSLLESENDAVVADFLAARPDFVLRSAHEALAQQGIDLPPAVPTALSDQPLRLSPEQHATDGFYAALMERTR
ncbi:MAG: RsmB/NOP family class I SAM-dependent RNA methyltransferase [Pseudomonadota bacterium]